MEALDKRVNVEIVEILASLVPKVATVLTEEMVLLELQESALLVPLDPVETLARPALAAPVLTLTSA